MNHYEAKQESRRERLQRAAARAARNSAGAFQRAHSLVAGIPFGQPILVGHHSERRHRNALRKHDDAMRRGFAEQEAAREFARRAEAVGTAGVASEDPDAPTKIRERIAELEAEHARMKDVNARFRKAGADALTDDERKAFARLVAICPYERAPFPAYALQNSSANIRRLKARLPQIASLAAAPSEDIELEGGVRLEQRPEENRTRLYFPGKPVAEVRAELKRWGFRWSPTERRWQRHYQATPSSAYHALGYRWDSAAQAWRAPQKGNDNAQTGPEGRQPLVGGGEA